MWNNYWEGARDLHVVAIDVEGGRSQGRGTMLSPEKCYNVWGRRKRPEEKPYKGRRNSGTRENIRTSAVSWLWEVTDT